MVDFADTRTSLAGIGSLVGFAVTAVGAGLATISVGGEVVTASVVRGLVLAPDDPILVTRIGSMYVVTGLLGTASVSPPPDVDKPPATRPDVTHGTLVVPPVATRSYRDGRWRTDTSDTLQGEYGGYGNSTGCAFYGAKPRSLEDATVTSASIRVHRERGGTFAAQTSTLWLVTEAYKPATAAPTRTSSTTGPSLAVGKTDNSFTIPDAWAQAMVDGTAGGLAIYDSGGSPYIRLAGKGAWSPAWTLTIRWTRS